MSDEAETTLCTNCKHDILSSNFVIHKIHCQRNIYLCSKCDEPVNRSQQEEHDKSYHTSTFCTSCHLQLEKWKLNDHLTNDCPKRKVKCKICEIETPASDILEHENYCGARTEKCMECGEFVMLKYKQLHLDSNHTFIKLSDEPGPSPSWQNGQRFLGNFLSDIDSGNTKSQSNQKKKIVQNRLKNSVDDLHTTKKIQNEAARQYSNEKNNIFQSNQIQKAAPTQPEETASGAVKKTILPKYSPLATSIKVDNTDPDSHAKVNAKAINKEVKKSNNTENDHMFIMDRLMALKIQNEELGKLQEDKEKPLADEDADLILALKINEELNREDFLNDGLIAQLSDQSGNDKALNTGFLMDSYEKEIDNMGSMKNIFKGGGGAKNTRKSDLTKYKDDLDDEFLIYAKRDNDKNDSQNIELPCEFCEKMIPLKILNEHQEHCSYGNRLFNFNHSVEEQKVECNYCGQQCKLSVIEAHESVCLQTMNYQDNARLSWKGGRSSPNKKSPNTKRNSNGFDFDRKYSNHLDSPKNNNEREKNFRTPSSGESSGAVPRAQRSRKNRRAPLPPNHN